MLKVILTGRLTDEPIMRSTQSGIEVCNFTVASDRYVKRGEEKIADFADCVAWRQSAAFVSKYFHKGDGIEIFGDFECRNWTDKDGHKRKSWEVKCDQIEFPKGKAKGAQNESYAATQPLPFDMEESESPANVTVPETDGLPF